MTNRKFFRSDFANTQKNSPAVTIVIPSYNRRNFLFNNLKALLKQKYRSFEVIVVDDGSTDGTTEFLSEFIQKYQALNLRWFVHQSNLGANMARNLGVRNAKGKFVAFLDSDCIPKEDWLNELMKGFESDDVASVTGLVENIKPKNIYDLAYKGSSKVHGNTDALRLVAGNMCVKRNLLIKFPLDEDLKYGCDEEGLFLKLRAAGFRQRLIQTAIVVHDHPHTYKTFFLGAWIGGKSAAWIVYKYHLPHRLDLLPFIFGYLSLPLGLFNSGLLIVPLFFFTMAIAALIYNDIFRKRKTPTETLLSFPVLLTYYHVRLFAYFKESLRLRFFKNSIKRVHLRHVKPRSTY